MHPSSTAFVLFLGIVAVTSAAGEPIVLTVHANTEATTQAPKYLRGIQAIPLLGAYEPLREALAEAESVTRGHAWISVRQGSQCTTYGLFGNGPTKNQERNYEAGLVRTTELTEAQYQKLLAAIAARGDYNWTGYYNCASYASELWLAATGELLNPVPVGLVWIDASGQRRQLKQNVHLKPLPPAPLGLVQEIIAKANGRAIESNLNP